MTKKPTDLYDRLFNNLPGGRRARDSGMGLALSNERRAWLNGAKHTILEDFPYGWVGLAEEFQLPILQKLGPPHVPQVFSALTGALIKEKHLEHTKDHGACRKRTSHACDGKYLRRIS
jgi:hypothetical protein